MAQFFLFNCHLKKKKEYSCFTLLCHFLLYSKVNQSYLYIYSLFCGFPSHLRIALYWKQNKLRKTWVSEGKWVACSLGRNAYWLGALPGAAWDFSQVSFPCRIPSWILALIQNINLNPCLQMCPSWTLMLDYPSCLFLANIWSLWSCLGKNIDVFKLFPWG